MSADFKQDSRVGRLTTDLGSDELVFMGFSGQDHLNGLFDYRVTAHSSNENVDFDALIGTHATVELTTAGGSDRVFDGIVTEARWDGNTEFGYRYALTLRPWLWLAGKRRNQRIFHNMTVVDIIRKVLSSYSGLGSPALDVKLSGSYPVLEYTVQYRESDMDFVIRLMERFGISYHFVHQVGSHAMTLHDDAFDLPALSDGPREFHPVRLVDAGSAEHFWEWRAERRLTTGAVRLKDYNFKSPNARMEVFRAGNARYAHGDIESFDFPGDYLDEGAGRGVVAKRVQQESGQDRRHRALGNVMSLSAGMVVTLKGHPVADTEGPEFVCLSAFHHFEEQAYTTGAAMGAAEGPYTAAYVFMPKSAPLMPDRKSLAPRMQGPQTATVVGEGEIDCDEHGRILVMFHWDLDGAKSMRCRTSQNWAGKGWGGMVIPRIGMEVVVEFLDGDPDRPLVTGCVYNGKNTPPYALPANKTRSVFKTNSHQAEGSNEIRFEDKGGQEEIFIHAQKDRNEVTENCHTEYIGVDWSQEVGHDYAQTIGHDKAITVANNHTEAIGANMDQTVAVNKSTTVGSNTTHTTGASMVTTVGAAMALSVGAGSVITVGADSATTVGSDETTTIGSDQMLTVGSNQTVAVAKNATESVGKKKTISVGDELTIVVGKSSIVLKKDGTINIKGKDITLNGSGKINVKASSDVTIKGSKVNQN
ncbi:MAG: hypothetical protein RLZZ437_1479 [Pseudomonadota bacterium]|jgi:type VI secretion system secreted protein VgrG